MPDVNDTWTNLKIGDCEFCGCRTNHDQFGKCARCHT